MTGSIEDSTNGRTKTACVHHALCKAVAEYERMALYFILELMKDKMKNIRIVNQGINGLEK